MSIAVQRLARGRFERSVMLKGLRGVGKTVLLNEFGNTASSEGWVHAHIEATETVRIARAIATLTRRTLLELSTFVRAKDRASRALAVLRSFMKVHVPMSGDVPALVIDFEPVNGQADSGVLDADLSGLFVELGEAARAAGRGVLFTVDEIQYLTRLDLANLIIGLHRVSQLALSVLVAGACLPSLPGLAGEARSYAERLFRYSDIGSLSPDDARRALTAPVEGERAACESPAVDRVITETQGYPYFLQEFGEQAWNVAEGEIITSRDVEAASQLAVDDLDQGFFRARIDKTTDAEREYLRAVADLAGPGAIPFGRDLASPRQEDDADGTHSRQPDQARSLLRAQARRACLHRPDVR